VTPPAATTLLRARPRRAFDRIVTNISSFLIRRDRRRARTLRPVVALGFVAAACTRDSGAPATTRGITAPVTAVSFTGLEGGSAALTVQPAMVSTKTYEGSGQSVHPDVLVFPQGWHGSKLWFSMTPYPYGNSGFENPSLLVSDDLTDLQVPGGVVNPLVPMPDAPNYNSDPDLVYDARFDRLVMSYRVAGGPSNTIMVMSSVDGQHWSVPHLAFQEPGNGAVSQTMVAAQGGHPAMAWYVNAGNAGCSATSTQVMVRVATTAAYPLDSIAWPASQLTDLAQPGYVIWHMKVEYVPSKKEYWALYVAYPADGRSCQDDDLFIARSTDGVHWVSYPRAMLRHELRAWTAGALYRSTFVYEPATDALRVWLSGEDVKSVWHSGYAQFNLTTLFTQLATPVHALALTDVMSLAPVRTGAAKWVTPP
jgi:hypothetical protein